MYDVEHLNYVLLELDDKIYEARVKRQLTYMIFNIIYNDNFKTNGTYTILTGDKLEIESKNYPGYSLDDINSSTRNEYFHAYTMYYGGKKIFRIVVSEKGDDVKIESTELYLVITEKNKLLITEIIHYVEKNTDMKFVDIISNFFIRNKGDDNECE